MHALCTIIAPTIVHINHIVNEYSMRNEWDYCNVGGRYSNLLPISKRTKKAKSEEHGIGLEGLVDGEFPYHDLDANPNCFYTDIARIRQIDFGEIDRLRAHGRLTGLDPYRLIVMTPTGITDFMVDETSPAAMQMMRDYIRHPAHGYYYAVVIDYHY